MPMDQAHRSSQYFRNAEATLKNIIFERKSDVVLEFLQVSLRSHELPMSETTKLIEVIESPRTAYKVIYNPATIVSLGSPLERDRVASDLEFVSKSNLAGAYSHLRKAGEELSKGQNRSTVREAILSVESAAKHITNNPSATLADALKQLQQTHPLHTAFKQGLEKLYAYTNDEKGIRHALIESENDRVGIEEAIFMFSACAAFVSYLIRKSLAEVSSTSGPAEKAVPLQ